MLRALKAYGTLLRRRTSDHIARGIRRTGVWAYPAMALAVTMFLLWYPGLDRLLQSAQTRLFDSLITHRFNVPAADPSIVILDIDEASLATLAPEYGRWPWPNSVLGEMVQALEQSGAKGIVFDILFSDWDRQRPESDAAFNAVIASTNNTYFPMLRLDPRNDALSQIPIGAVPGAETVGSEAKPETTVAMILPKVPAALDNGRLGTNQVEPDHDGVIRRYPLWTRHAGWRVPSLPMTVARDLEASVDKTPGHEMLLNWRGPPFSYRYVSFAAAYRGLVRHEGNWQENFNDKIVIIGSTAPSLFDVKGTPMARIHPGVEILATAIDNLRHRDMLHERPRWAMQAAAILLVWLMAWALFRQVRVDQFDVFFGVLQLALIAGAFILLNITHYYVDVSAPVSIGLAYFAVARVYYSYSDKLLANSTSLPMLARAEQPLQCAAMAMRLQHASIAEHRKLKGAVDRMVAGSALGAGRVAHLIEDSGFVKDAFIGTVVVYWVVPASERRWRDEAQHILKKLQDMFPDRGCQPRLLCHQIAEDIQYSASRTLRDQSYGIIVSALSGLNTTLSEGNSP